MSLLSRGGREVGGEKVEARAGRVEKKKRDVNPIDRRSVPVFLFGVCI